MHKIYEVLYEKDNKILNTRFACKDPKDLPLLVKDFFGEDASLVSFIQV